MSETKWTPGWRMSEGDTPPAGKAWACNGDVVDSNGELLATFYPMEDGGEEIALRNARLAVAAAKMYEALVAINENWGIGGFTGPEDPRAQDRFTDRTIAAWRKIREALAKARGEA